MQEPIKKIAVQQRVYLYNEGYLFLCLATNLWEFWIKSFIYLKTIQQ